MIFHNDFENSQNVFFFFLRILMVEIRNEYFLRNIVLVVKRMKLVQPRPTFKLNRSN